MGFWVINRSLNLNPKARPNINQQEKKLVMEWILPFQWTKIKESEKTEKYLDFVKELKKKNTWT